ncbi:MAG TPA: DNA internalization-related competence protein ComEC/Rec2, partial [Myxococcota bacterium]|nr:DNA internalization-related competence protein ComEC/Rec2 [Myxococcota bacterium]
ARRLAAGALMSRLSADHAAVARGLVMGDRGGLGAADREAWADAGLAHLLAVSGMHVTMVVVAIGAAVRFLVGRVPGLVERCSLLPVVALVALPAALLFCAWSASPASAVRATLMGSVGLVGSILGRPARAVEALAFTGLAMLVEQPLIMHDAGFVLSMAAVAALLASPRLRTDAAGQLRRPLWRLLLKLRRTMLLGVVASVAATLAALPITAVFFGRVSLVAPLTNLAAVPIGATLATPLALALVIVAPVAPRCADWIAMPLERLLGWLLAIVHVGEQLPGATVALAAPRPHELVFYGVALTAGFAALRLPRRRLRLGAVFFAALLGLVTSALVRWVTSRRTDELVVLVPYVGQGDGIVVRFPGGQTAVVDAGGAIATSDWDPGRRVIAPLLRKNGVTSIDLAVVSHPHPDHIGGFVYLAERFHIVELWRSGQHDEMGAMARLEESVTRRGGRLRASGALAATVDYGGVRIDVVHPRVEDTSYLPELDLNDNSVVLRLRHGARSILLTGDIEAIAEREIVATGVDIAADILKVAHHGSRTSSTPELLDAVRPWVAVASCGVHNQFGFPHPEVMDRFSGRDIPLLSTAKHGAVTLRTDGVTWRVSGHRPGLALPARPALMEVPDGD